MMAGWLLQLQTSHLVIVFQENAVPEAVSCLPFGPGVRLAAWQTLSPFGGQAVHGQRGDGEWGGTVNLHFAVSVFEPGCRSRAVGGQKRAGAQTLPPRPELWWVGGWPDSHRGPLTDGGGPVVAPYAGQWLASCGSEGSQDT